MHRPSRCRCGHDAEAHEHFRAGRDCGACPCRRYRDRGREVTGLPAAAVTVDRSSWRRLLASS